MVWIMRAKLCLFALALWFATQARASIIIENVSVWNGTSQIAGGNFQAVGQTFTIGTQNSVLDSFTLYLTQQFVQSFEFKLMEWTGSTAKGPIIFKTSGTINGPTGPDPFTFDVGGVPLVLGKQYVAFADIGPVRDSRTFFGLGITSGPDIGSSYPDGDFVAATFGQNLTGDIWDVSPPNGSPSIDSDAVFVAHLSVIPEPATLALFSLGLAGLGFGKRRKRQN